jgi:hypothetical protein
VAITAGLWPIVLELWDADLPRLVAPEPTLGICRMCRKDLSAVFRMLDSLPGVTGEEVLR